MPIDDRLVHQGPEMCRGGGRGRRARARTRARASGLSARGPALAARLPARLPWPRPRRSSAEVKGAADRRHALARRRPRPQRGTGDRERGDPRALRQARAAQLRRLRRGAHVLAGPRLAPHRDAGRGARAHDLRGHLAARRRSPRRPRSGATCVLNVSASPYHLGKGQVARGDARDARPRRPLHRRLLQSRRRPGRARLRRPQCRLRARGLPSSRVRRRSPRSS